MRKNYEWRRRIRLTDHFLYEEDDPNQSSPFKTKRNRTKLERSKTL